MKKIVYLVINLFFLSALELGHANTDIKTLERTIEDSVITTKIKAKFTKSTVLNPLKISVKTSHGNVTLSGHAGSKEAFIKALQLTKSTQGVQQINVEDLSIQNVNTSLTDTYITAKIETAILKAKVLDDESIPLVGINAKTVNGVVTLSGKVPNKHAVSAIIKRVNAVKGVKKIISQLEIR